MASTGARPTSCAGSPAGCRRRSERMPATQSSMAETLVADLRTLCVRVREALWKRWRRSWKIALIDKFNPDWRDLAEELAL